MTSQPVSRFQVHGYSVRIVQDAESRCASIKVIAMASISVRNAPHIDMTTLVPI